jgi:YfiH family protein
VRLGTAHIRFTGRAEGDLGRGDAAGLEVPEAVERRRQAVCGLPWTWLHQVHGARVVRVTEPGEHAGTEADAAVTTEPGVALAVLTADCAPVALAGDRVLAVVHAGWRGLVEGVLERAVVELRAAGATTIEAALGPCIHAECYEFGGDQLDRVADRLGPGVRSRTTAGAPALDLPAAVRAALDAARVPLLEDVDVCTACSADHWSHRARGERERQALVAWL